MTALLGVLALAACGGGGGGGTAATPAPVATPSSFPLKAAYAAMTAAGYTKSFTISGSCSGSATVTQGGAIGGASFEGNVGVLAASQTLTTTFTNCTPVSSAATSTGYYDSNYNPLGSFIAGSLYRVFPAAISIPSSVTVGSTGTIGTSNNYATSAKSALIGQTAISYVIEADTATTAIVNLIARTTDSSGRLTSTEQDRFRITAAGAAAPVSIDIQYAVTSTAHLVFQ